MKKLFVILMLIILIYYVSADTIIPDSTEVSGIWSYDNSPYIVEGEAIVPEDSTLIIEPGVTVRFQTGTNFDYSSPDFDAGFLRINGTLRAIGTVSDSILFVRDGVVGNWGTIFAYLSSVVNFSYCEISHAYRVIGLDYDYGIRTGAIQTRSSLTLTHCQILNNQASGIGLAHCQPSISDCIIKNNLGAGVLSGSAAPTIISSRIENNSTGVDHSALGLSLTLTNCDILNNQNDGIITSSNPTLLLSGNLISGNGGYGINATCNISGATIVNCQFEQNGSSGMLIRLQGNNIHFKNNYYINNGNNGATIVNNGGNPTFLGNVVVGNGNHGLELMSYNNLAQLIANNTITENGVYGIYSLATNLSLENNIIWNNTGSISNTTNNGASYIANCILEDNSLPYFINNCGGNLLNTDPMFEDTINNNYSLSANSPAVNRGRFSTTFIDTTDISGNNRFCLGRIDIGAYEYQQTGDWLWVTSPLGGEFIESGSSFPITWIRSDSTSSVTIELFDGNDWSAISNNAINGGEYLDWTVPSLDSDSCLVRITDNVNNEITHTCEQTFSIKTNIIEHNEEVSGIWTIDESPYTVVGKAIIPSGETLTIEPGVEVKFKTGSMGDAGSNYFDKGMLWVNGKLEAEGTAENPINLTRNGDEGYWGMLYFTSSADTTSILSHCNIEYADALITSDFFYGGISFNNSTAIIENCDISNCYFGIDISYNSHPLIRNNNLHYNAYGGIILWTSLDVEIISNAIYNNGFIAEEVYGGTGIYCYSSSPALINNTISLSVTERNSRTEMEIDSDEYEKALNVNSRNLLNGIYCESSSPDIINSLIYANGPFEEGANIYIESGSPHLSYCLLEDDSMPVGAVDAGNNIFGANPYFVDPANENFQLQLISPCINVGTQDTTGMNLPEFDLNGDPRIYNGSVAVIDIGAYEFQGEPLDLDFSADVVTGEAPIQVEFTASANYTVDIYQWDFNNDEIIDAEGETVEWEFASGIYTVTLSATVDTEMFSITKEDYITSLNSPPTVENPLESFSFLEDTISSELDLNTIFSDPNGDSLSFSYSGNDSIAVYINPDGIVNLSAPEDWFGSESVTFIADDGYSDRNEVLLISQKSLLSKKNTNLRASVDWSIDIIVEPVNDPPILNITGTYEIMEDEVSPDYDFSSFCSQVWGENDELTLSADDSEHIDVTVNDFIVSFQSNTENWYGTEEITFYLNDNAGDILTRSAVSSRSKTSRRETVNQVVQFTVLPINDSPEINLPDNFTFDEDTELTVDFSPYVDDVDIADIEDLALSVGDNVNIYFEIDSLMVTFIPSPNWNGIEAVIFTVNDNQSRATASDTVNIIVNPINDPPEIDLPESFSFNEDESITVDFSSYIYDIDGDTLLLTAEYGEYVYPMIDNFNVTFTAFEEWNGSEIINFTVNDDQGRETASDEVLIIVESVNDPPMTNFPVSITFDEDTELIEDFSLFVYDVDGDELILTVSGNENISVEIDSLLVTFIPAENWNGTEMITFTVDDQQSRATAWDDLLVIINPINDLPEINLPDNFAFTQGSSLSVDFTEYVYDADGDFLSITNVPAANIIVEINNLEVTFSADPGFVGSEYVFFMVDDAVSRPGYMDSTLVTVNEYWDHSYGDIDDNGYIEAFDSAIILQYTVGIDPQAAPLPWEEWQFAAADVSGDQSIGAYDAALVLQYVVGIIYAFPVQVMRTDIIPPEGVLEVIQENGFLKFCGLEDVYSLELELNEDITPSKCSDDILLAVNNNKLALASACPLSGVFLSIPLQREYPAISYKVNDQVKEKVFYEELPSTANILSCYPNPFNPETTITFFTTESTEKTELSIYNLKGQKVCTLFNGILEVGEHSITWKAENLSSGIYLLKLRSESITRIRKLILLK